MNPEAEPLFYLSRDPSGRKLLPLLWKSHVKSKHIYAPDNSVAMATRIRILQSA